MFLAGTLQYTADMVSPHPTLYKVAEINQVLLRTLLSDWGLMAELTQLRNFYLLASPTMQVTRHAPDI